MSARCSRSPTRRDLPLIWDVDFMLGPPGGRGELWAQTWKSAPAARAPAPCSKFRRVLRVLIWSVHQPKRSQLVARRADRPQVFFLSLPLELFMRSVVPCGLPFGAS